MFDVQTLNPLRPDRALMEARRTGIRPKDMIFDTVLNGYRDHGWHVSTLDGVMQNRLVEAADEIIDPTEPACRRIRIRGHADRVWVRAGRNTHDEKRVSAQRATDVWRILRMNLISRGFSFPLQVRLEAIGALEPLNERVTINELNRRVEILLFDNFEPLPI